MSPHKTITVNGRIYDAATGLPVEKTGSKPTAPESSAPKPVTPKPAAPKAVKPVSDIKPIKKAEPITPRSKTVAGNVHTSLQRSQTLNRQAIKKPVAPNRPNIRRPVAGKQMDIAKSSSVSRFAKNPAVTVKPAAVSASKSEAKPAAKPDKPAQSHPVAQRAMLRVKPKAKTIKKPATSKEIKDAEINKAIASLKPKSTKRNKKVRQSKTIRRLAIIGIVIAVVLGVLFAVYQLLPSVSVGIASARAGISASYPEFVPDGYSLSQPVTYSEGEVDLKFKSNSNDNYYTITQTRSSWDSSAVLDNIVTPSAGADYVTTRERGLTIYTYDSVAVWVNGGLLYKIDSKAPLSGDQIRRIATSL